MKKKLKVSNIIPTLALSVALLCITQNILAEEQPQSQTPGSQPVVFAPNGLEAKDQAKLERTYRESYLHKDMLLTPYVGAEGTEGEINEAELKKLGGDAKLYRYLGVSSELYKSGRLEEAVEILRYISAKNPDDEYISSRLHKLEKELRTGNARWTEESKRNAELLKKNKVRDLLQDGIVCYNEKRFDEALFKFADILKLDPSNVTASKYMNVLKDYYLREIRVENIIQGWEGHENQKTVNEPNMGQAQTTNKNSVQETAAKLLNEKDEMSKMTQRLLNEKDAIGQTANELLDKKEVEQVVVGKKAGNLLDQTELGFKIEDMVNQFKDEEERKRTFTLGAGDTVQISVRDHPELSGACIVRLRGDIILPLTNELVKASDLTIDELTNAVTEKMKRYVKDPDVNVGIIDYKSRIFYVVTEGGCAPYPITRANFTLRDALFASDWGDGRALGRVLVMKPSELHPIIKKVDAFDIIYRGRLANNMPIENGDVIYVPMTAASKISKTITDSVAPVSSASTGLGNITSLTSSYNTVKKYKEF